LISWICENCLRKFQTDENNSIDPQQCPYCGSSNITNYTDFLVFGLEDWWGGNNESENDL